MANTPKWAPKPKPEPQSVEARKLDDLLDAVKIVGSAIASIDTRPVVDLSGLPTPKVEVQPAPVVQQSLDVKALAEALREVLNIEVAGPDLSGLDAILKRAIEEMPRGGGGGGGRSAVKLNNRSGQSVNPATAEGLADVQAAIEALDLSGGGGGLTDAELRASDVAVTLDGEQVAVSNFPATQTDALTDAELRAADVKVTLDGERVTVASDDFARAVMFEPLVGEEIRRDETLTDDYHGIAPDGTSTAAASWKVARFYKDAEGIITRVRYRTGVAWDSRTAGW